MNEQNAQLALQLLILAIQNHEGIAALFARTVTPADLDALTADYYEARDALQAAIDKKLALNTPNP